MRSPEALQPVAPDLRGAVQPFGVRSTIIGQRGRLATPDLRASCWNFLISEMHCSTVAAIAWCMLLGVGTFHKVWRPAVTAEQALHFLVADASQQGRVVDLVSVEVKNRKDCAIANGVQELADVPGGRQRARFRFPVSDYSRDDQVGVVEGSAAGMREHVPEFASFMDRAWCFGSAVAADAARERELPEEFPQPGGVFALVGVDLGVGALQVDRSQDARSTVPWSGKEDHVQVIFLDQSVQVNVGKCQARACSPVSEEPVLDVLRLERFPQQGIILQIDHAQAQVVTGPPVGMGFAQGLGVERRSLNSGSGPAVGAQRTVVFAFRDGRYARPDSNVFVAILFLQLILK